MIYYKDDFRTGKIKTQSDVERDINKFLIYISNYTGYSVSELFKNTTLPSNSFEFKGINFYAYNDKSRNMLIGSRINEMIKLILKKQNFRIHIVVDSITKSQKDQLFILWKFGAEIIDNININISEYKFDAKKIFSTKENTQGLEFDGKSIKINKTDKNFNIALLYVMYLRKKHKDIKIEFANSFKPTKKTWNIYKHVLNSPFESDILINSEELILKVKNTKAVFDNSFFDNKINKTYQENKEITISRNANLHEGHNNMIEQIANYYMKEGFKFSTEKLNIDLLCIRDGIMIINEIKDSSSSSSIFKGVGQLLYYKRRVRIMKKFFQEEIKEIKMKFWMSKQINQKYYKFLNEYNIEVEILNA